MSRIRAPQIRSGLRPLCLERLFRFFRKELIIDFYANLEYQSAMVGCGGACDPYLWSLGACPCVPSLCPPSSQRLWELCLERLFRFFRKELIIDFYANLEYKSAMVGCGGACCAFRVGVPCGWNSMRCPQHSDGGTNHAPYFFQVSNPRRGFRRIHRY